MAYIESHETLGDHPKLKRAAEMLGISEARMVGHLHYLWWWALNYAPDGSLAGLRDAEIARAAHFPTGPIEKRQLALWDAQEQPKDQAEAFVRALLECSPRASHPGFLERDEAGLAIHDWDEHTGKLVDYREILRSANAKRQRDARARRRNGPSHADVTGLSRDSHVTGSDNVTRRHADSHADVTGPSHAKVTGLSSLVASSQDVTPPKPPSGDASEDAGVSLEEAMVSAARVFECRAPKRRAERVDKTPRDGCWTRIVDRYSELSAGRPGDLSEAGRVWNDYAVIPVGSEAQVLEHVEHYFASDELKRVHPMGLAKFLRTWRQWPAPRKDKPGKPANAKEAATTPDYLAIEQARWAAEGRDAAGAASSELRATG